LTFIDAAANTSGSINGTAISYTDFAAPVVVSVSPTSGNIAVDTDLVITFSEPMDTTFDEATEFTVTPDPGTFTETWTVGDTVVTLDSDTDLTCSTEYTITTDAGEIDAAAGTPTALATTGPSTGDWSFTTCQSAGSSPVTPLPTYEALLLSPNGGESLNAGNTEEITWSTGGTGTLNNVDLLLSLDGGLTYSEIATAEVNDGSYFWTVPIAVTSSALIKVEAHNNLAALATDTSDTNFTILTPGIEPEVVVEDPVDVTEPATGEEGTSPITGEEEDISVVNPGDLVRSATLTSVYYVDDNMIRHPFPNEAIYATWYDSFAAVKVVTDATLPTLSLGESILPRPGHIWVKIQSVDKVYLIEENPLDAFMPTLRWITSEELAEELLGADWADYIMDIDVSLFGRFDFGEDVLNASDVTVDVNMMKKRVELNI
jgi:hypothetical protein